MSSRSGSTALFTMATTAYFFDNRARLKFRSSFAVQHRILNGRTLNLLVKYDTRNGSEWDIQSKGCVLYIFHAS